MYSLRARFKKVCQMSIDITGIYELVKNAVSTFCTLQCLITLKNLVSYFLAIFNVDALPLYLSFQCYMNKKGKYMTNAAAFLTVTPMNFRAVHAYRSS